MKNEAVVLPTAPKAARSSDIDTSRVPRNPPFKIYMGNIPYDFDEDMLKEFFSPHEPIAVELPKGDKGSRGFGYVEFGDRESLIAALAKDGTSLGQRNVRISLPDESGRGRDGDRPRRDGGMGGIERDPGRTDNDWRREPRELPPVKADAFPGRDNSSRGTGFDRGSSGGFDRNRNGSFQPYQPANQRMDARPEPDFDNVRRQDPNFGPRSSNNSWERNQDTRPRFAPSTGSDRPPHDDGYQSRYQTERRPEQGYHQNQMYNDSSRDYQRPPREHQSDARTEEIARDAPVERKRLQLQPRSKPKEEIAAPAETIRSSIFGDAKPVDTAKKELEIEEKLKTTAVPVTEPDLPSEDGARLRRTSTGSGKSGNRSRQTSESGSHHSPREMAPAVSRTGYHRQENDMPQADRRPPPPRILTNPDRGSANHRDDRSHQFDRRDNYERRDNNERRDNYERRDQYERRNNQRGGYYDRPPNRRDENTRYENNGRGHYDGQSSRVVRGHPDDHNRTNDRNNERRDRQPKPDRPRTDMKTDKELVS